MSQGFSKATKAMRRHGLVKESMRMRQIKREHAAMKRWFAMGGNNSFYSACDCFACKRLRSDVPGLFKRVK